MPLLCISLLRFTSLIKSLLLIRPFSRRTKCLLGKPKNCFLPMSLYTKDDAVIHHDTKKTQCNDLIVHIHNLPTFGCGLMWHEHDYFPLLSIAVQPKWGHIWGLYLSIKWCPIFEGFEPSKRSCLGPVPCLLRCPYFRKSAHLGFPL